MLLAGCTTKTAVVRETTIPVALPAPAPTTTAPPTTVPTTLPATTTTPLTTAVPATTTTALTAVAGQDPAAVPPPVNASALPAPLPTADAAAQPEGSALGTIEIPRIGLNKSLYEGISIPTLNRGPGHWPGTALPGQLGNVVVGGHRTTKGRPFRHLEQLVAGDEVIFTTTAGRFMYRVVRTEIVTPDQMWIINQTEAYTATLFACHPAGSTRERIVVFLELTA